MFSSTAVSRSCRSSCSCISVSEKNMSLSVFLPDFGVGTALPVDFVDAGDLLVFLVV